MMSPELLIEKYVEEYENLKAQHHFNEFSVFIVVVRFLESSRVFEFPYLRERERATNPLKRKRG